MAAGIGQGIGSIYNASQRQNLTPNTGYMSPGGPGAIY
jgi:hypothetical protein